MSTTQHMAGEPQLIVERSGPIGRITLNRPKALNSLTLEMVRGMQQALHAFENDPAIAAVLVTGAGDRGLCAGGDIRAIYESGRAGNDLAATFWREEYLLDAHISRFRKPFIVVADGITMGGGVGIFSHANRRIVTDRTRLAMPETGIGYFPDVGATWLLSRGAGEFGTYLGLTGDQIGAGEAMDAGLADMFIPSSELAALIHALCALPVGAPEGDIEHILKDFSRPPPPLDAALDRQAIDRLFAFDDIEAILAALDAEGSEFAVRTRDKLLGKSPTSLKLTLRLLRLGRASASLKQCLEREFVGSVRTLASPDFYEGVRAAVIDKDRNPKWSPDTLAAVGVETLDKFMQPLPLPALFGVSAPRED